MPTPMNMRRLAFLSLLLAVAACEAQPERSPDATVDVAELPAAGEISYDVDTLAFVREGRPVMFSGMEWWPQQEPIHDPLVTPVGRFEGVVLYAAADETLPYEHLFIPAGGSRWLGLLPTSRVPADAAAEPGAQ